MLEQIRLDLLLGDCTIGRVPVIELDQPDIETLSFRLAGRDLNRLVRDVGRQPDAERLVLFRGLHRP
ncbi:hypothetical protein J2R77_009007 [Bradyrhizobium sp. USDA 4537]|nr:hypothetical protein [Bradyrhizobium sp. USDA 4537]